MMMLVAALMSGCRSTVKDVSDDVPYAPLMGQSYRVVGEVEAVAIRLPGEAASFMILDNRPSLTGPEVAFKRAVPLGQTFKITGAQLRDNILDDVVYLTVDMTPNPASPPLPVWIALNNHNSVGGGQLESKLYQRLQ